jgi:hypothetical protein
MVAQDFPAGVVDRDGSGSIYQVKPTEWNPSRNFGLLVFRRRRLVEGKTHSVSGASGIRISHRGNPCIKAHIADAGDRP